MTLEQAWSLAVEHHMAGRLDEAERLYVEILKQLPHHPEVHHYRGIAAMQRGDSDAAIAHMGRAVELKPDLAEAHSNLCVALREAGRLEDAETSGRRALELQPRMAAAHSNLGNVLRDRRRLQEAAEHYQAAIRIDPRLVDAHNNLANIHRELQHPAEAEVGFRRALELQPRHPEALMGLADVLSHRGRLAEAAESYQRALDLRPDDPDVLNHLGMALSRLGRRPEAVSLYRRALERRPYDPAILNNLANALCLLGRLTEAEACCREVLERNPECADVHGSLGNVLSALGRLVDAEASYRRAIELAPNHLAAHSAMLFDIAARGDRSPSEIRRAHEEWDRMHGGEGRSGAYSHATIDRTSNRPLRIGYLSPDFRDHVVSYFFEPVLESHDRRRVEVFCYAETVNPDDTSRRLERLADRWCVTTGMGDEELARRIHDDRIDILIDLAGHTAGNRLGVFTWKPAPIQATWLGYFAGTGLSSMDYWITDRNIHPDETGERSVERIARLPRCWVAYRPPVQLPIAESTTRRGHPVFASFSDLSKLSVETLHCWAAILDRCPTSRLLLKAWQFADRTVRSAVVERFREHGIATDRLVLQGKSPRRDYFAGYNDVDVVLDPFPRTGGTTTADALWMGVPVVTLIGERYAQRISAAKLVTVGCEEWIASTPEEYVEIAVSLAEQGLRGREAREALRARTARSELMDGKGLARALEDLFDQWWSDPDAPRNREGCH